MPVQMIAADQSPMGRAQVANLSITGALIKADFETRLLSRVRIVFESSLVAASEAASIGAYIVRSNRDGIGIEWCEPASPVVMGLLRAARLSRGHEIQS
jgi:hypothetical protein